MRSATDLIYFIAWFGGAPFLLGAGLTYAFARTALRGAGLLLVGSFAVLGVMLLGVSLSAPTDCSECRAWFYVLTGFQVLGWLLGAALGWALRWVFRR